MNDLLRTHSQTSLHKLSSGMEKRFVSQSKGVLIITINDWCWIRIRKTFSKNSTHRSLDVAMVDQVQYSTSAIDLATKVCF